MESFGLDTRFGEAVSAEVFVNGMLAGSVEAGHRAFQSLAIQQDVMPGNNRIEMVLTIPSPPGTTPPIGNPATMFAELVLESDAVQDLGDRYEITTTPVGTREWRADAGAPIAAQHRLVLDWAAPPGTTVPIWMEATPLLPETALARITAELEELRSLLSARQIHTFQAHMHCRNADMARAYPVNGSAATRAAADSTMLDEVLPAAPIAFAAIVASRLRLRSYAGGRVIACMADDGKPPLRTVVASGEPLYIAATFAMLDGQMVVIR